MTDGRPTALRLDPQDNVAVVIESVQPGQSIEVGGEHVVSAELIRAGHKIAVKDIECDSPVIKYGEPIGKATHRIPAGFHVHVHNTVSLRLPGGDAPSQP